MLGVLLFAISFAAEVVCVVYLRAVHQQQENIGALTTMALVASQFVTILPAFPDHWGLATAVILGHGCGAWIAIWWGKKRDKRRKT